jgi:aminopeptidase N
MLAPSLIPAEREVLATLEGAPNYILTVAVDLDVLTVEGTAQIRYTNNEHEELDAIYLRLYPNADHYAEGETQIDAVTVDGDNADFKFEDAERTVLKVPLSTPLKPNERTELQIAFSVIVPQRSDRFGYDEGVMSLGHWYPMLAVYDDEGWNLDPFVALGDAFYSDAANFTVFLTVPEDAVVAATGVQVEQMFHRPPRKTVVYVSGATRDFALAISREYEMVRTQVEDTTVTAYYLPGHEQGGQRALDVAADALEVYNDRFGRYPYTELDVAETSFTVLGSPGGMEFPGIVFISSDFYEPGSLYALESDVVVAHEVAHQWWYGVVGNNQVDEPWLDEAFATYSSIVYFQDRQDQAAAEMAYWSQAVLPYQFVRMLGMDGPLQSSLLDYNDDLITYQSLVYGKGALFLARLRELLGDEAFFALLQFHYEAHKYDLLNPDGFRQSLEQATGNAEALALYDAVVVRGEPIEGLAELEVLAGLDGLLEGKFSPEEMESLLGLAGQLGGFLDGEVAPEDLGELLRQLGVFLGGELAPGEMGDMMGLLEQLPGLLDGEVSPEELDDALQLLQELLEGL